MEEVSITKSKIKHVGTFSFGDFYKLMYETLKSMGYVVIENEYKIKKGAEGDEVEINWDAYKTIDDYTRFRLNVFVFIVGLKKVQMKLPNGATVSRDSGDVSVSISGFIQTDYLNRWETHPLLKFLKGIYDYYIYRKQFEDLMSKVVRELGEFENELKSFFEMSVYM